MHTGDRQKQQFIDSLHTMCFELRRQTVMDIHLFVYSQKTVCFKFNGSTDFEILACAMHFNSAVEQPRQEFSRTARYTAYIPQ